MAPPMARVLIVDDDPNIRELVTFTLQSEGHDVRAFQDAETAERELPLFGPEAVVLDVSLPGASGFTLCQRIREDSRVPVLFLTGRATGVDVDRGFQVGGDDYLVKPFRPSELALRVAALLRRNAWVSAPPASATVGDLEIDPAARTVRRAGDTLTVSPMELDILVALASTPGAPWSPERLARRLGLVSGTPTEAGEVMRVKINRLRLKIEPDPARPRYLHNQRGTGYLLAHMDPAAT
jgi:two-component system response regulator MtrA